MRNILTVTFWAALSPWIVRNGLVAAGLSGEACVPESKLFMGICAPPVICSCCTSDWWCWWWWCCCCTNWYKRAWCCSLSYTRARRGEKKKIKNWLLKNSFSLGSCLPKSSGSATLNPTPVDLGHTNEVPQGCGKGKKVLKKFPAIGSSTEVQLSLLASSGFHQKKHTREQYQIMFVEVPKLHN